ncbi:hypothetical protein AB0L06_27945 [Spirillospora sp. NPDC052269]
MANTTGRAASKGGKVGKEGKAGSTRTKSKGARRHLNKAVPANAFVAAQDAIEIAKEVEPGEAPVPVQPALVTHSPGAGLAYYGMWVEMFKHALPARSNGPYTRGRIWA